MPKVSKKEKKEKKEKNTEEPQEDIEVEEPAIDEQSFNVSLCTPR